MEQKILILIILAILFIVTFPQELNLNAEKSKKDNYFVKITVSTTKGRGDVIIEVHREWAPLGASRFYELIESKFYNDAAFFRVLKNLMAQIGINKDPAVTKQWRGKAILDDATTHSNERGTVSFACAGKNTRTTQIFFNVRTFITFTF